MSDESRVKARDIDQVHKRFMPSLGGLSPPSSPSPAPATSVVGLSAVRPLSFHGGPVWLKD